MKSKRMERQMNKKRSADDPSVDLIRVKNMLIIIHFYELPWCCNCIEHKVSLEAFRAIEAALVKHDNNMKDYSLVVERITITANHSNYLVWWEPTRSLSLSGKWQNCNPPRNALVIGRIYNIVLFGGKNAWCSFFNTLIDAYALFSDVIPPNAGYFNDPGWEIPGPLLPGERCWPVLIIG